MSNFTNNWIVMGYTILLILAVACWPITLTLFAVYILSKIFGTFFKGY